MKFQHFSNYCNIISKEYVQTVDTEFSIQQGGGISNMEPSTSAPENDYRQFYEIIDNREQVIEKFYGTRQRMTIHVHSLEHCPNP